METFKFNMWSSNPEADIIVPEIKPKILGKGTYGAVHKCTFYNAPCVCKIVVDTHGAQAEQEMLQHLMQVSSEEDAPFARLYGAYVDCSLFGLERRLLIQEALDVSLHVWRARAGVTFEAVLAFVAQTLAAIEWLHEKKVGDII
jgi:hypothetical protein